MNYDNGSTMGGLFTAVALAAALWLGYHLKSWGWVVNIDGPVPAHPSPQEVKGK
jgi:hypothetical protein